MAHAETCPVCYGAGKIRNNCNPYIIPVGTYNKVCHGCNGKGWIEVGDTKKSVREVCNGGNTV